MIGIILILGGVPEGRSNPFGNMPEVLGGIGCIALSIGWGVAIYRAYQQQSWAIRTNFWLSLIGLIAVLYGMFVRPVYQIAVDGEWGVLVAIVFMTAIHLWIQNRTGVIHPLIFVGISFLVAFVVYRCHLSQNDRDIVLALGASPVLTYISAMYRPYFKSCHSLWKRPPS